MDSDPRTFRCYNFNACHVEYVVFVFNVPSPAKVIWRRGHDLVSSDRLVKPGIEPATPGLQGKWFIHYTTAALVMLNMLCSTYLLSFLSESVFNQSGKQCGS